MRDMVNFVSGARLEEMEATAEVLQDLNALSEKAKHVAREVEFVERQLSQLRERYHSQTKSYAEMSAKLAFEAGLKETPKPGFDRVRKT